VVACVVGVEATANIRCFVFGERDLLVQTTEERRRTVETVCGAGLLQIEATIAQIVEIIVEVAARDAETVGYLLCRIICILCKYEY
jgi:hypothetical protein